MFCVVNKQSNERKKLNQFCQLDYNDDDNDDDEGEKIILFLSVALLM